MDSVLLKTPMESKPFFSFSPASPNYSTVLQESINRLLGELRSGSPDFSGYRSVFSPLLHSIADPPLEVIWLFSAVSYHEAAPFKKPLLDRVLAVRELLQLLASCSAPCNGLKCVAVLAPAVSELYKCVVEEEMASEKQGEVKREIESLIEGILGYIGVCCSKSYEQRDDPTRLLPCFGDLVQVWTMQQLGTGDDLGVFFPLVGDATRGMFMSGSCDVGYLAGVVIAEAFLLRLCMKVQASGSLRAELQELRIWAVSSTTAFGNRAFFDILLRLILDSTLPVIPLLNSKNESLVRDILYDVVILVDYSFLSSGLDEEHSYDCLRNLALLRLIVTHEAVRIARAKGDHAKAISYISAFSSSSLPNGLLKLVADQIGMERLARPNATTPQAFLEWLIGLEAQGLRMFEDISDFCSKLIFDESKVTSDGSFLDSNIKKADSELFFLDKQGEVAAEGVQDDEMEAMDSAFVAAAQLMKSTAGNVRRKRKDWQGEDAHVKFTKYKIHCSSVKQYLSTSVANGMRSGSEVDNPPSDDDMEETEQ